MTYVIIPSTHSNPDASASAQEWSIRTVPAGNPMPPKFRSEFWHDATAPQACVGKVLHSTAVPDPLMTPWG